MPLRLASWLGLTLSVLAFLAIPVIVALRSTGSYIPGFATTNIIVLLVGGLQLLTLGVVGEYLGRVYAEVRDRPLYVVDEVVRSDAVDASSDRAARRSRSDASLSPEPAPTQEGAALAASEPGASSPPG